RQQLLDRLARSRGRRRLSLAALLLGRNRKARLLRRLRRKQRVGGEARDQKHQTGSQHGTEDFVDFQGVHFGSCSGPEGRMVSRLAAVVGRLGKRLSHRTPRRPEISVCPCSGNPYKRAGFRQPPPNLAARFSPVSMSKSRTLVLIPARMASVRLP